MEYYKIVKLILIMALTLASEVYAAPLALQWDPVTQNSDGTPVGPVIYRLYKKSQTGPYVRLASPILTQYTWQEPAVGDWTFVVRAVNKKKQESSDSNEIRIQVIPCWSEVK